MNSAPAKKLSRRTQLILALLKTEKLTQTEIAGVIGCSKSRVSHLYCKHLKKERHEKPHTPVRDKFSRDKKRKELFRALLTGAL